ncbi:MAG TPA: cation:proton antiporter [Micromonosporaceae bacterium]|jgi:cell volume regulation protein A
MSDVNDFGLILLAVAAAFLLALVSSRFSALIRVPAPAVFLIGAAIASDLVPSIGHISTRTVERLVTTALIAILFDGGMHIGWRRFRAQAKAVVWLGVAGTVVTAGGLAVLAHLIFDLSWTESLLIGTALAPTDPAVVFSVLGGHEIEGRTGTLLEGESGANDPVGIALMVALLGAHSAGHAAAIWHGLATFVLQMVVGIVVGVGGGLALREFMARVRLPSEGLYALRALAGAYAIYGLATVAHGSGFLAVLIAGVAVGDAGVPYRSEIRRFHASLASIAEIVAFVVLGLTVDLRSLLREDAWLIGLVLAVLLALVVRPILGGLVLWPISLTPGERIFVLWSGLKGAVPILLGVFVITAGAAHERQIYAIIFVVVLFSVIVQGGLVPWVARRCGVLVTPPDDDDD